MSKLRLIMLLVLTLTGWVGMRADFNPDDPPEPNGVYVPKHNITVVADPDKKGYTTGTGRYKEGTTVIISTSSVVADWHFKMWLVDGVEDPIHRSDSFYYTLGKQDVVFTAVYEYQGDDPSVIPPFDPSDPGEPDTPTFPDDPNSSGGSVAEYTLTLVSGPFEASSFNISSGNRYTEGTTVNLNTYGNQFFYFNGWFDQDADLVSTTKGFTFTMPAHDVTLTASWRFDPDSPDEPIGDQTNVDNPHYPGDVNQDQTVSILDVMLTVSYMLGNRPAAFDLRTADINGDGIITIFDVMALINLVSNF